MIAPRRPIVTFMAAAPNPNGQNPLGTAIDPKALDGISKYLLSTVRAVRVPMPDERVRKDPPPHMFVQVPHVLRIVEWLNAYIDGSSPDDAKSLRVQLVGHAQAGAIALGASWMPAQEWYSNPYYIFNSNPRLLLFLSRFAGHIHEVMLAGCFVGSWNSNGFEVNGRTLMFTLAEMWKCKVRGADEAVSAAGFKPKRGGKPSGWYEGEAVAPIGWAWTKERKTTRFDEAAGAARTRVARSRRALAAGLEKPRLISGYRHTIDDRAAANELARYFDTPVGDDARPRLALSELELELDYAERRDRAQLLCGGQFLRVERAGGAAAFYTTSSRAKRKRLALRRLISQLAAHREFELHA